MAARERGSPSLAGALGWSCRCWLWPLLLWAARGVDQWIELAVTGAAVFIALFESSRVTVESLSLPGLEATVGFLSKLPSPDGGHRLFMHLIVHL